MIHAQNAKHVNLIKPVSVTSQTTISATVSVVGWDYAELKVVFDTATNGLTNLDFTEGDTTSSFATHADTNMTTAVGNSNAVDVYMWYLDLRKRKKNLKIAIMPATAARLAYADIRLSRGETAPTTAALQGATAGRVVA